MILNVYLNGVLFPVSLKITLMWHFYVTIELKQNRCKKGRHVSGQKDGSLFTIETVSSWNYKDNITIQLYNYAIFHVCMNDKIQTSCYIYDLNTDLLGFLKNHSIEVVLVRTQNLCFWAKKRWKIIYTMQTPLFSIYIKWDIVVVLMAWTY